jgi:hypothetical protein
LNLSAIDFFSLGVTSVAFSPTRPHPRCPPHAMLAQEVLVERLIARPRFIGLVSSA